MIPYPIEPTTCWTRPAQKRKQSYFLPSSKRLPPASSPSEDFEEFVHVSVPSPSSALTTPNHRDPTSPLKHLAHKAFPSLRPVRAQDFEERALQARKDDARRGRVLRCAEEVNERAERWRREERELASEAGRRGVVEEGRESSSGSTQQHRMHCHEAQNPPTARRSRSPRLRINSPQQHPDDFLPPLPPIRPSIRPVQPSSHPRPRPHSSYHSQNLVLLNQNPTRFISPQIPISTSSHFHIDSSNCSRSPSVHEYPPPLVSRRSSHNHQPRPTRHSGDLRDREYVRKRDLLAHPVIAIREGRVRRGGEEEVFGSDAESGSFVREEERDRITPFLYPQGSRHYEEEAASITPALSMSSSKSPSFSELSESYGELFGRLREEKGEGIERNWFRFNKDGHVEVDVQPQISQPIIIERSRSTSSRSPSREIIYREVSRAPPLILRSNSSSPTPLYVGRPSLPRSAHSFPSPPPTWERQSLNPPASIADSQLTYNHLGKPIKLTTPSPLSQTLSPSVPTLKTPTSTLDANLNQASLPTFDDWKHITSPLDERKTFIGIGKMGVEAGEWEKRGRWISWRNRGDWVDWASKKKEKKEERNKRWSRRSDQFVYDY